MHAAAIRLRCRPCALVLRTCKARKPRLDCGKHAHEAARLQEFATPAAARRQIAVEGFLTDLVHVKEGVGRALLEGSILNIFADDARPLLVTAAEEIGAGAMVRCVLVSLVAVFRHDAPSKNSAGGMA